MEHVLDVNRKTALSFTKKARHFLNLPKMLFQCDIRQCNPNLYSGRKGRAAVKRAKKGLAFIKQADASLKKLCLLLEN